MYDKRLTIYVVAAMLGAITGVIGSLFQLAIRGVNQALNYSFAYLKMHGLPIAPISALVSMVFVYLAWYLVDQFAKEASGSGVQEIEGALQHRRPINWRALIPVKFFGGVLAIAAKMVVGREGPTIQMGGNLGEMIGEWVGMKRRRRDVLIAAGSAAGLAAAFNAPLAGVLFVMEEMRSGFNFSFTNFTAVTVCCVFATIVLHLIIGSDPAISMAVFSLPSVRALWLFVLFGLVVGVVGLLFNKVLMKSLYRMDQLTRPQRRFYVLIIGLLVGYLSQLHPAMVGGGYEIIESALTMSPPLSLLCLLLVIRFVTTMLCYNTNVPGGIFAPMLALGTILGLAASYFLQWLMVDITVHPGMFAVAGMGALFAAAVRAPITGIVLVVEMTHNYLLILPLMLTCLTATIVVQLAGNAPIYTQLLKRTLKNSARIQY